MSDIDLEIRLILIACNQDEWLWSLSNRNFSTDDEMAFMLLSRIPKIPLKKWKYIYDKSKHPKANDIEGNFEYVRTTITQTVVDAINATGNSASII